ncbi:MAG: pyridoxal phosphate-dependent aminotransferase, partial [Alicyclobacillus sp.]|nr:pyridoxal phosphate-dependent aminotransferase [Alicyclobacillus sp.]
RHGWDVQAEWICHGPGVVPALGIIIDTFTQPGDRVVVQPPVYYPFFRLLRQRQRQIVHNPLRWTGTRYEMDLADLERHFAEGVRMLILCSPHNPVGRVWTRDELMALGELCDRYDVLVVADEIHGDLVYAPHRHTPFASLSERLAARTLTCVAPSKTFNLAGLHTSCVIASAPSLRQRYEEALQTLSLGSINVFGLTATEAAYRHGGPWLAALLRYLEGNVDYLQAFLQNQVPEVRMVRPEGTYLVWLDCQGLGFTDDAALHQFWLKEAKLALDPGDIFGPGGEGFMRINIGCPRVLLEEALHRLAAAVANRRASTGQSR